MVSQVFTSMSSAKMAKLISSARKRVSFVGPAIRMETANAMIAAREELGNDRVSVVLDCDEEVLRLGYGAIEALKRLRDSGCEIGQCSGLHIGVLVCDERAWVFAPTALYVQPEVHSDETPNAVELRAADVERLVWRVLPVERKAAETEGFLQPGEEDPRQVEAEIGHDLVSGLDVTRVEDGLAIAPPIPFNIARQVRVFQPYIQYVDISLTGCAIERRRAEIPKSILQALGATAEIARRLRTTFDLVESKSEVSSRALGEKLRGIRDNFTRPLGRPWGRVLLRCQRDRFDARIAELRGQLEEQRRTIEAELSKQLDDSRHQLVEHYVKPLKKAPPDALVGGLICSEPTDDDIRKWLNRELAVAFPDPESLVKEMQLHVQFRDVTYETLNERGFSKALEKAFPDVNWKKPFDEYKAAKERGPEPPHGC